MYKCIQKHIRHLILSLADTFGKKYIIYRHFFLQICLQGQNFSGTTLPRYPENTFGIFILAFDYQHDQPHVLQNTTLNASLVCQCQQNTRY